MRHNYCRGKICLVRWDMKIYKSFLAKICDIENVSVKELMDITGKSQSVVYSWLNLSKDECFPTIESLGKILFRLGISFDDFINCRHPVYDNGESARVYYRYIYGSLDNKYIGMDLLELPNADEVIKTYLFDKMCLNKMINDYICGIKIDLNRFDLLCKTLMPFVVSEHEDGTVYDLHSDTLFEYKEGVDRKREYETKGNEFDVALHQVCYPDANEVILLVAANNIKVLNEYFATADDREKRHLLQCYLNICSHDSEYDKKNKIIKKLIENKCEFFDSEDKNAAEKYHELLKRVLQVV